MNFKEILQNEQTLDPQNWDEMKGLAHKMVEDMFDYLQFIGNEPVWKPIPTEAKTAFKSDIPQQGESIESIYNEFKTNVLPYTKGNIHPRFWAFVQGTGTPFAMMADMLASAMNPNVTIGEHAPMYVDEQVINWCKQMLNFPSDSSGILLSGGSMANITAIVTARNAFDEQQIRKKGVNQSDGKMILYMSSETHSCVQKGVEIAGLGSDNIRKIKVDKNYKIDIKALKNAIKEDKEIGNRPFCLVANAGTVNTGAIDDMDELLKIAKKEKLWFHIDGAYGALAKLTPECSEKLKAIEQADSIAFDLHKWLYMPYEVGCVLIKNKSLHRQSFALQPAYLLNHERGLAAGPDPITNYGFELSRGFKALKVWMSLKEHGLEKFAYIIRQNIAQANYLKDLIEKSPNLELLAPVETSIVCFRYIRQNIDNEQLNAINKEIMIQLQEKGIASPSFTFLDGKYAIRIANVNHRSRKNDFDALVNGVLEIGMGL